jgi:chromosome partitioning protein
MAMLMNSGAKTSPATEIKQIVLWIGANAGGVGKTSLTVNIAYKMACLGVNVCVLDLDTNESMTVFCGLDSLALDDSDPSQTMAGVLAGEDFDGQWPLVTPTWGKPKGRVDICRGGLHLSQIDKELSRLPRSEYVLSDKLQDFPLTHQLIILDCPASLGVPTDLALAAATHVLVPVTLTPKSAHAADKFLIWFRERCRKLRLNPYPTLMGFVPTQYRATEALERTIMEQLPEKLTAAGVHCYPSTRYTPQFKNASAYGLPLQVYRPGNPACNDCDPIIKDLCLSLDVKFRF